MFTKETVTHRQNSYEFNWDLTPENVNALFHDLLCEYGEETNPNMYYGRLYVGKVLADICISSNYLDSPQRDRPRVDKTKYILIRCYYILSGETDSSEKIEGFNLWYNYATTKTFADYAESYEKKEQSLKTAIKSSLINLYSSNYGYFCKEDKKDWEYVLSMKEKGTTEAETAPADETTTNDWTVCWDSQTYSFVSPYDIRVGNRNNTLRPRINTETTADNNNRVYIADNES